MVKFAFIYIPVPSRPRRSSHRQAEASPNKGHRQVEASPKKGRHKEASGLDSSEQ